MKSSMKKRSSNFTPKEVRTLLVLVKKYRTFIECRRTDSRSNELKNMAWEKITREFNGNLSDGIYRSVQTLRLKYENAKKQSNRKFALLLQMSKNGVDGKTVQTLNITDIDKDIKRLTSSKTPESEIVKIEVNSDNEENGNCKEEEQSPLLNREIDELSEDPRFVVINDVGNSTFMTHTELSATLNESSLSAGEATDPTQHIQNDTDLSDIPAFENVDCTMESTHDMDDLKKTCFLEEHNLQMKHLKEMHKLMLQHQESQNRLLIRQQEEMHREKLRIMKEEHAMKMRVIETQRIANF